MNCWYWTNKVYHCLAMNGAANIYYINVSIHLRWMVVLISKVWKLRGIFYLRMYQYSIYYMRIDWNSHNLLFGRKTNHQFQQTSMTIYFAQWMMRHIFLKYKYRHHRRELFFRTSNLLKWFFDSNRRVGVWSLPWRWYILSIPLTTGRKTGAETCGLDDVFPTDDLCSSPEALC